MCETGLLAGLRAVSSRDPCASFANLARGIRETREIREIREIQTVAGAGSRVLVLSLIQNTGNGTSFRRLMPRTQAKSKRLLLRHSQGLPGHQGHVNDGQMRHCRLLSTRSGPGAPVNFRGFRGSRESREIRARELLRTRESRARIANLS